MNYNQNKNHLLLLFTKSTTNKLAILVLVLINCLTYGITITLPTTQYKIDEQKKLILCNSELSNFKFDDKFITLKLGDIEYQVIDAIKELKLGKKYTLVATNAHQTRYSLYFTNLPLLSIDTNYTITDSPKVLSTISIIEQNGNNFISNAGIEYRGATSQAYPKKSFEIELWEDTTGDQTQDVSLLNMREDKDWNLQALYNEVLKVRSTTAWSIWEQISSLYYKDKEPNAKTGIATQYVEVFQNNTYLGVFALSEKIDRKQLKLKKSTDTEIKGELYKADTWESTGYYSFSEFDNTLGTWGGYELKYPKNLTDWTNFYNLHNFVINSNSEEFEANYANKYDVNNLVDYFIFLNLLTAKDNTAKNIYTAKYDKNGKYFFIPWDLDGIFGRNWDSTILNEENQLLTNGLYDRLLNDKRKNGFRKQLATRWEELRDQLITTDNIMSIIIENTNFLKNQGIYKREIASNLDSTIESEAEELIYIRDFLIKRIEFLDKEFDFTPTLNNNYNSFVDNNIIFYPNPTKNYLYFLDKNDKTNHTSNINIYTLSGRKVKSISNHSFKESIYVGDLAKGTYFISFGDKNRQNNSRKLILN